MHDDIDKSNKGYTIFKSTGVRYEYPQVDLIKQIVTCNVLYKGETYMTVVVDLNNDTVQVQENVEKRIDSIIIKYSNIEMIKGQAKFFIDNNISNPKKYYDELVKGGF